LHLGSLYTAVASVLDARAHQGRWLLRIEDLDRPREVAGSADSILQTLQAFGFEWDGEIVRQRDRDELYAGALRALQLRHLTCECSCSRFSDRIQGRYRQEVSAAIGDIILRRRDQVFAYLLAVVVDDAAQGVTHVVRGADLLDNTPRQILLQQLLGLPTPLYAHVPVLTEPDDTKLAKSRRSIRLSAENALPQLLTVFSLLGMVPPKALAGANIAEAWSWAIGQWQVNQVPKRLNVRVTG
jgi:glutamyl-Q tRNA(Asp) synthetase